MSPRRSTLAGTSTGHIRALANPGRAGHPPIAGVRPQTAARILAITATDSNRAPGSGVAATGTRRRVQELVAAAWLLATLAAELDRSSANLTRSISGGVATAQTAATIRDLPLTLSDPDTPVRHAPARTSHPLKPAGVTPTRRTP